MKNVWLVMVVLLVCVVGCSNPETPAGSEGYVYEAPRAIGNGGYQGVIVGPGNYGMSLWRNRVTNIDMRPMKAAGKMYILTKDGLNVSVYATVTIKPITGKVREVVEKYNAENWYSVNIAPLAGASVRKAISGYTFESIKASRAAIEDKIYATILAGIKDMPFTLISVKIGDVTPPQQVLDAINKKLAYDQEQQSKLAQKGIAKEDAEIKRIEAAGIADSQAIINKSLTPEYLQYKAIEAQMQMANSPNHTTVYIPSGNNAIPLVRNVEK